MAIVPLVKATFYGPAAEKDAVLDGLQRLGCLHLIDLRPGAAESPAAASTDVEARAAWQYLQDSPVRRRPVRPGGEVDLASVVRQARDIRERSRQLAEERSRLRKSIAELEPWGDFALPSWARDGALRFWFYVVPLHQMERLQALQVAWQQVRRDHRFAYVVVVAADEPDGMPAPPVTLEPRRLSELRARADEIERQLEELDYQRIGLTLFRDLLAESLDEADDRAARARAGQATYDRGGVFALQGWAPQARADQLRRFAAERRVAVTIGAPGAADAPPTLLDNPPALRGGEGMVAFYKTPGYSMWDPSQAVFFAFALFFGMIFSDAGYGLVLGLPLLLRWRRFGESPGGRSARGVLLALVVSSVVYGVLIGSYFGVVPPRDSWLGRLHVLDAEDQSGMMLLSIGIGVAHVCFANLVSAWRHRKSLAALHAVGWLCVVLGGFAAGLGKGFPQLASLTGIGARSVAFGCLLVLLFTSERPFGLAPRLLLGRLLDGLQALTELTKAFGDVLSYLRLFALGLASIKLAEAFNGLAGSAFAAGGAGVLLGLLVLVVGHAINFTMGIMGGVVHGLRLNVIEFFNWSLPEEGEQFRVFDKKAAD